MSNVSILLWLRVSYIAYSVTWGTHLTVYAFNTHFKILILHHMKPGSVVTLGLCNINTLKKSYMCDKHASKLENVLQHSICSLANFEMHSL